MTAQEEVHCSYRHFGGRMVDRILTAGRRIEEGNGMIAADCSCRSHCCRSLEVAAFRHSSLGMTYWL